VCLGNVVTNGVLDWVGVNTDKTSNTAIKTFAASLEETPDGCVFHQRLLIRCLAANNWLLNSG